MEKYLITDFKKEYAYIILNNQKELNPDYNESIEGEEVDKVKKFFKEKFGIKDISELLANPEGNDETTGTDTVEISEPPKEEIRVDDSEPKAVKKEDSTDNAEPNPATEEPKQQTDSLKEQKLGFYQEGTGAEDIMNTIMSDIALSSAGTPFSDAYGALCQKKKNLAAKNEDTSDINNQIEEMRKRILDYIRDNYTQIEKNLSTLTEESTFKYGKDKSKTGSYTQIISLKGNGGIKGKDNSTLEDSDEENTDNVTEKNSSNFGVLYGLNLNTENSCVRFLADVSSDNIDLALAAESRKQYKLGILSASGAIRETIESGYNEGSGGLSVDYVNNKKNFFAGIYGLYNYNKPSNEKANFNGKFTAYGQYKNTLRLEVNGKLTNDATYYDTNLNIRGKKELTDKDLTLFGQITPEYSITKFKYDDTDTELPLSHHAEIRARGNIIFHPEQDTQLSFGASGKYGITFYPSEKDIQPVHEYAFGVLGNFTNKHVGVTAMVSGINVLGSDENGTMANNLKLSSNVTVDLHNLFKGITPYISYTLNTGAYNPEHNIGGGIKLSLDALSNKK